eukprot:m.119142 g.119142  ORF g.119142 m.119142 type:complete len:202 (-) comp23162_c0_seq7:20-625(-)
MRLFVKTSHLKPLSHLPSLPAFFFYCKVVTPEQVAAYTSGKQDTLNRVFEMISPNGTVIAKGANPIHPPPFGGNMKFLKFDTTKKSGDTPEQLLSEFQSFDKHYKYVVFGGANYYEAPTGPALAKPCLEDQVALYLLVAEPGTFILCHGWEDVYDRPLGKPSGPAKFDSSSNMWTRSFAQGTSVQWWTNGTGIVHWAAAKK